MTQTAWQFFTPTFKARNRLVASAAIVLASAAPFAIGLMLITYLVEDPTGWAAATITLAALLGAGAFTWVVQNKLALVGNSWLRQKLQTRLAECEDIQGKQAQVTFVGFSPGEQILTWDGETDLDVGFLCVFPHGLVFIGDRFTWSLSKERVDRVDLTPAPLGPRRIVIHWHAPREPGRAFTLESREANSLRQADAATVKLFRTLRTWSTSEVGEHARPFPLGHPPTDEFDGRPVDEPPAGWCAVVSAMMVIIVLTIWYLAREMLKDGFYYHAILWAGFVFVGGAVFTRCLLHYLQSSTAPRKPRSRAA